ncbi:acetylglutamate kinase [Gallaecimonas pentaromativorans]|uniref:Acetylglutamate kinase n=1 Tax=Gallaecimonas pentaromativorans TaxID=584787 RepID=A0A3N1P466_9GAMM|nr:acetylglutamate kinase [Gallaecimonas pentaromativorans]ROQ23285.1 N-acetylglutamate kinase [Gallaecimonas pentaromativorans]
MKPLVVKIGGAVLDAGQALESLLSALVAVKDRPVVLVHGGGDRVDQVLKQAGIEPRKFNGKRITDAASLPLVVGTLAGEINKTLAAKMRALGGEPVGLSLADGIAFAEPAGEEWGAVGVLTEGSDTLLSLLLQGGFIPVVSSIAASKGGDLLNINADEAAAKVAELLDAELVLLSDVPGVLDGNKQLLPSLTAADIAALKADGVINGGMVVKVDAALFAAGKLGRAVRLASWRDPQSISNAALGTQIAP